MSPQIESWREKHDIFAYEVDESKSVTLPALANYLQQAAWNHAGDTPFGFDQLQQKNLGWALSRFVIRMHRYPLWNDTVTVETWLKGVERLFIRREYAVLSETGEMRAAASSAWLLIDMSTKRPQKMSDLQGLFPPFVDRYAAAAQMGKLPVLSFGQYESDYTVRYSDLDMQHHVNNVEYIKWILNCFPLELRKESQVTLLEMNYLAEARYGEKTYIRAQPTGDSGDQYLCSIAAADGEICRARVTWGPR